LADGVCWISTFRERYQQYLTEHLERDDNPVILSIKFGRRAIWPWRTASKERRVVDPNVSSPQPRQRGRGGNQPRSKVGETIMYPDRSPLSILAILL
jgi:hypothetical protein